MSVLYRVKTTLVSSGIDEDGFCYGEPRIRVWIAEYNIKKVTPKGCWVNDGFMGDRFVLGTAKKRFAYPTKEEAIASFLARKARQVKILESQVRRAKIAAYEAEKLRQE